MQIETIAIEGANIAHITADELIINNAEDGLDLLGNLYYQGFDKIILYQHQITSDFFSLKTGLAGEILQKFSNYRVRLAIIGDFSTFTSKSTKDFIYESNKGRHINFVSSLNEAVQMLSKN